ncbi:MAG: NAD(P)/FAD-dependent oxidoreductase [Bacteroidales bacterium]|nr:NAD(P)/FAD-dependent oxidoreductase [Bacteroidales bacterium]
MFKQLSIELHPEMAASEEQYKKAIARKIGVSPREITGIEILKKSIDARKITPKIIMSVNVWWGEKMPEKEPFKLNLQDVTNKPEVIVVGAGPAGLFAALKLIENGFKPIVLERGKNVSERKVDVASINRNNALNEESNYCFGEGGAGTFSDGKLYTRSKKRGSTQYVLDVLKLHGAEAKIFTEAHPHIGTNNLPRIIVNIRETIVNAGGKIIFNTRVDDLIVENNEILGVITQNGDKINGKAVILATGHSARDIYELLHKKSILLEAKSFAMGVRVEHNQMLIDTNQYNLPERGKYLPAASYSLVTQVENRGVYSFCMCPGGYIVPAATSQNEMVVNGMSPSNRDSVYANSGIVVEIREEDFPDQEKYGVLAGLKFQQYLEKLAFEKGGENVIAPAQTIADFVGKKNTANLPATSYNPGVVNSDMHNWLPEFINKKLRHAFNEFNKKIKGFVSNDAIMLGVESRTSSPVRIPRDKDTLEHVQVANLYPCGEGAGYAGGIVSAAIDGIRCAEMISAK